MKLPKYWVAPPCPTSSAVRIPFILSSLLQQHNKQPHKMMDLSDFEIIDPIAEFGPESSDEEDDPQPPFPHPQGGHPPWQGHEGKLVGVVDMGR
jgi:hypothetical protein